MRYIGWLICVTACILLATGCESFNVGGSPRCPGGQFYIEPHDRDGSGQPDGIGIGWRWFFVIACSIPGEDVGVHVATEVIGGARVYRVEVIDGPGLGEVFKVVDVYDAISTMDQVFKLSGYDMNYQETSTYRDNLKTWLINNWVSASDFHALTGY